MKRTTTQSRKTTTQMFETLEGRQLMSASPFVINGTPGNDNITVNYGISSIVLRSPVLTTSTASKIATATVTGPVATATTLAKTSAATKSLAVVSRPSIFNNLTYTVNGVTKSTTLQAGQSIQIYGLDGNDNITVTGNVNAYIDGGNGNDVIRGGSGNNVLYGNAGNDIIYTNAGTGFAIGGDGNDTLYAGTGEVTLNGGNGDDIMVSIGGNANDYQYGGAGNNSFWVTGNQRVVDATTAEAKTNVHRVNAYDMLHVDGANAGTPSLAPSIGNLPDPDTTFNGKSYNYANFSNVPLFGNSGPVPADINQGGDGDCYFLATLSAVAKTDPNAIEQSVVNLGDGTYAVDFKKNGVDHFVRVDADLPVNAYGGLQNAHFGNGTQDLWAPIMEKAWAFFRSGAGTYASINSGFPSEVLSALGDSSNSYEPHHTGFLDLQTQSATDFSETICSDLSQGQAVILCTPDNSTYLESDHCYMVDHVNYVNGKIASITIRNPWGTDGKGANGPNDGYITMTGLDVLNSVDLVTAAKV